MASYKGHLTFSSALGAAVGAAGVYYWNLDWGPVFLAAGLTAVGGLLPDLDSDSGVPVREMFTLAAVFVPLLLVKGLLKSGEFTTDQMLVILAGLYLFIRFGVSHVFKQFTVHRGMYHSVPAMLIAGLAVFLLYQGDSLTVRIYMAVAVMIGFFSHLVLDEIWAVDFMGIAVRFNKYAGSAMKFWSGSVVATATTYAILLALGGLAYCDWAGINWSAEIRDAVRSVHAQFFPPAAAQH